MGITRGRRVLQVTRKKQPKRCSVKKVFLEICEISKNTFFKEHVRTTASDYNAMTIYLITDLLILTLPCDEKGYQVFSNQVYLIKGRDLRISLYACVHVKTIP